MKMKYSDVKKKADLLKLFKEEESKQMDSASKSMPSASSFKMPSKFR